MRALAPLVALIGFTAVTAQAVLMRELLVLFGGTEISLGLTLASWLAWTALGAAAGGTGFRAGRRPSGSGRLTALLEIALSLALPLTILAARMAKASLQTAPAEIFGLGTILLVSLAVLAPFCTLSGWLFASASGLWRVRSGAPDGESTSSVYLLESAGAAAGGLLAAALLIPRLDPLQVSFVLSWLNLLAAAYLLVERAALRLIAAALLTGGFAGLLIPSAAPRLERWSLARLWSPLRIAATANSRYGNLVVVDREDGVTIYENGLPVATIPDQEAAEETVHYALLQHPAPGSLLLIGGGVNGSLGEALKHPSLRRLDYVELDPAIPGLARRYAPDAALRDPRVRVRNLDARRFLKTAEARYDVIIVNLPDPQTAQLNRFYTLEFFREAHRRLEPGGVLSIKLAFSENYISPELAELARCIRLTLGGAFRHVTFLPGPVLHLFASDSPGLLLKRPEDYIARLRSRGIQTTYVREYSIPFRMGSDRMEATAGKLRAQPGTPVNRDFAPVAYYFNSVLWSTRLDRGASRWMQRLASLGFGPVLGAAALSALACMALVRKPGACAALSVTTAGLTMIGLQILLLAGFQAIHGYVYHQLTLLIALFMAGMAAGSWLGLRAPDSLLWRRLALVQTATVAAPLAVCLSFWGVARAPAIPAFGLLALLSGLIGGVQFPLASRIYFAGGGGRRAGALYALDLAGSAAGAVLISAWLLPLFGFWLTALLVSVVSLASLAAVLLRAPRAPAR
ncbi:MAG: fused MFS/spermidine synthase [Bryobacterales bacterium]|nr:fused MFS/spermidine synthase [Bryobacterales bacterium]